MTTTISERLNGHCVKEIEKNQDHAQLLLWNTRFTE